MNMDDIIAQMMGGSGQYGNQAGAQSAAAPKPASAPANFSDTTGPTQSATTTPTTSNASGSNSSANWWERSNSNDQNRYQGSVNYGEVAKYPGLEQEYTRARSTADQNSPVAAQKGLGTSQNINDYAKYWYDNIRDKSVEYVPQNWGSSATATPAATGGDAATKDQATGTPGAGVTTGSTSSNRNTALNQALSRAKIAVAGRGLDWANYDDELFTPMYNDIYNSIPDTDTNPNAWFDPTLADTLLNGQETRQRSQFRQQANGLTTRVDPHMLDSTIDKILGDSSSQAQTMLDNGLKRGQFNEVGFNAGRNSLTSQQQAARARLLGMANDIGSGYADQLKGIQSQALNAASGYQLGDTYNLGDYSSSMADIMKMYQDSGAGDLYNLLGDTPLIDMNSVRMGAGTAQGAINLNDLDVLDALSKRRTANDLGRGLGSQGAF